jgi:hypothetical protein
MPPQKGLLCYSFQISIEWVFSSGFHHVPLIQFQIQRMMSSSIKYGFILATLRILYSDSIQKVMDHYRRPRGRIDLEMRLHFNKKKTV